MTAFPDGQFVVTWRSFDGSDGSGTVIRARLFNADGTAVGNDFVVNTTAESDQFEPTVTTLLDGHFVVTWTSQDGGDGDGGNLVRAIIIDPAGIGNVAPTITSNGGDNTAAVSHCREHHCGHHGAATDPDVGQTLSYSIIGGADASKFTIDPTTGALSFITAPDFETADRRRRQQCLRRDRAGLRRQWRHRHAGDCGHG